MRIAHLPANFFPVIGGAQIATHNIAENQALLGHDVFVINRMNLRKPEMRDFDKQISYTMLPLIHRTNAIIKKAARYQLSLDFILGWQLMYYQKKYKFDVWHLNLLGPFSLIALPYLKKMKVPIIGTCRGMDIQRFPEVEYGWRLTKPGWEEALKKALMDFDLVTAISDSVKSEYLSLGVPEEKIKSIPNGSNFEYIDGLVVSREAIRKELGWPEDKKIIITVGRNHPKKGYKYIPEILHHLLQKRNDFLWVIVGKGAEEIYEIAKEKGVHAYLQVIPQIGIKTKQGEKKFQFPSGDLVALYKSADIFAFPTLIETFGNVNVEAMVAGLPVIVTNSPGCRDLVKHEYNGLLSPVGDTQSMADNILRVMGNEELANRITANAKEFARSIEWKAVASLYIEAYEEKINS